MWRCLRVLLQELTWPVWFVREEMSSADVGLPDLFLVGVITAALRYIRPVDRSWALAPGY